VVEMGMRAVPQVIVRAIGLSGISRQSLIVFGNDVSKLKVCEIYSPLYLTSLG
jgi:hypothetical protein